MNHVSATPATVPDVPLLQQFLGERDVECPLCAYNLRGLTGSRCPECGEELRLQVGLVEPRFMAFVATVAALCMGFGGAVTFGIIGLAYAPASWWRQTCGRLLIAQAIYTFVAIGLLLVRRRRFRRLPPPTQMMLAMLAWVIVLATSFAIVVTFKG
jgi:hypothetical protein